MLGFTSSAIPTWSNTSTSFIIFFNFFYLLNLILLLFFNIFYLIFQSQSLIRYCPWRESCRFVGQTATVFNFILNLCSCSKQFREASTKPNHYKMVINCGPNIQNMREREREREVVSWEMGERDRAGGSLWIWVSW